MSESAANFIRPIAIDLFMLVGGYLAVRYNNRQQAEDHSIFVHIFGVSAMIAGGFALFGDLGDLRRLG